MTTVGITGHRGLTSEIEAQVRALVRAELSGFEPVELVGVTCLADGADTLFAREVLARGGSLEVIVPAAKYREGLPVEHHADYDELLGKAREVRRLDYVESDPQAHMAASMEMLGLIDELLAVWDGQPSRSYGGSADVVTEARKQGLRLRVVWPEGATRP